MDQPSAEMWCTTIENKWSRGPRRISRARNTGPRARLKGSAASSNSSRWAVPRISSSAPESDSGSRASSGGGSIICSGPSGPSMNRVLSDSWRRRISASALPRARM